jgi:hypothetical protein
VIRMKDIIRSVLIFYSIFFNLVFALILFVEQLNIKQIKFYLGVCFISMVMVFVYNLVNWED